MLNDNFLRNWCGYVSRDATLIGDIAADPKDGGLFVETVAYQFAQVVIGNLIRLSNDDAATSHLIYHAAMGLMKGAADGIAAVDPKHLAIDPARKN